MSPRVDLSKLDCSVARTLDVVGDRWTMLVLRDAFYGVRRFDDFVKDLGIARNVLADRLARLVDAGVLVKREYQQRPVRHEYRLTDRGRELLGVVLVMMRWGDDVLSDAPPVQLVHTTCGNETHAVVTCACCDEELTTATTRVQPLPPVIAEVVAERRASAHAEA